MRTVFPTIASGILVAAVAVSQDEQQAVLPVDDDLPQPVTAGHFEAVLNHSPFVRTLNLSETFELRGVAEIDGEPVATLYNRETKKTVLVTVEKANEEGMKLVEVTPPPKYLDGLVGASARIAVGSEEVELEFENSRIAPRPKNGGSGSGPSHGSKDGDQRRGPSKADIERYKALSEAQKEKLRNFIRQTMQKYPNMSREERGNLIRGAMTKLSEGRDIDLNSGSSQSSGGGGDNRSRDGDRR